MADFLFRGDLVDLDPKLEELTRLEAERQYRKLILIPSESTSPLAVRQALGSAFHNIYAEGYPPEDSRWLIEEEIFDYQNRLAEYRRYSDPRYYKGVEYADIVEALARRRCAETFAANGLTADDLYVNVQALSGGPANNAVYHALVQPGDTVMGMDLLHGGHLSHGSPVNRSGKFYNIISYSVDPETEKINYDSLEQLALAHTPKMIIAGVSSYPWKLDFARFREIADRVGAYLFADIAHVAGMVAVGEYPSPIGYADVITFTTHKSLCGPRGAVIMTPNRLLARKIDRAVFPGEQGGPHVNVFAAMATAFRLAQTEQFQGLQRQTIMNCKVFSDRLKDRGLKIAFGGTDTHLMNLDTKSITGPSRAYLSGDQAARILDLVGVVTNRNTIPGDRSALNPSGVRMGMHWVTQRGFKQNEILELADVIADLLESTTPYFQDKALRAKVDFDAMEAARHKVNTLAINAGIDFKPGKTGYPHFYQTENEYKGDWAVLAIGGDRVRQFLNFAVSSDLNGLGMGQSQPTRVFINQQAVDGILACMTPQEFRLCVPAGKGGLVAAWLRDLSDGFVRFDQDLLRKIPGPVWVSEIDDNPFAEVVGDPIAKHKSYFIGITEGDGEKLPEFQWQETEAALRRTPVYDLHVELGGRMVPFAGWEMPVVYSSIIDEHKAVRDAAGLFDVTHMGVYQAEGPDAAVFLDCVCGNDISSLAIGESLYTHFLSPDAEVIDDLLVYRRAVDKYLIVVNAANDEKDWSWLNAVRQGDVLVDRTRPWAQVFGSGVILRNLRDPQEGDEMRVDLALQGPRSRDILLSMEMDDKDRKNILRLLRTNLCEVTIGGNGKRFNLIVSRTGYTGEKMAFELFVHPDNAHSLFRLLLEVGEPFGLKPVGLGARDSLRTEAGLPLYGHEMGIDLSTVPNAEHLLGPGQKLGVAEAGFGAYVKTYKPWFIGRDAYLAREETRKGVVVRFRFVETGVRMAHLGDPVMDKRGRVIGMVTSCAADKEGYLLGQAYVELKYAYLETPIYIFQGAPKKTGKAPAELGLGDRVTMPTAATVLRRFPK